MRLPRVPRIAWVVLVVAFAGLEGIALVSDAGDDTFSALVGDVLAAAPALAVPLVGFLAWLAWHFVGPVLRGIVREHEGQQAGHHDAAEDDIARTVRDAREDRRGEEADAAEGAEQAQHDRQSRGRP
ncbi:MAG: hypothetical protein M0R75_15590 [Dehalococcoidia bacterium]|nr:hypothetical protein [Dehalococcoidia bacterium]